MAERIGAARFGAYVFYDYDGKPIYVRQTKERVSGRIARHLSDQRLDAVAMTVLDPLEVAEIEVCPVLRDSRQIRNGPPREWEADGRECAVYRKRSRFKAVLNEKDAPKRPRLQTWPR